MGDGNEIWHDSGVSVREGRIVHGVTNNTPAVVHFVSYGHWNAWRGGLPTTPLHEVFRDLYPGPAERLLDTWQITSNLGSTHSDTLLNLNGVGIASSLTVMRSVLCFNCNVLRSSHNECLYFPTLFGGYCLVPTTMFVLAILSCVVCIRWCFCSSLTVKEHRSRSGRIVELSESSGPSCLRDHVEELARKNSSPMESPRSRVGSKELSLEDGVGPSPQAKASPLGFHWLRLFPKCRRKTPHLAR